MLESILAEKVGDARAREVFGAVAGVYEMRLGDAHPTSSKIGEALQLAGIDAAASYLRQGEQLIGNFAHAVWVIGSSSEGRRRAGIEAAGKSIDDELTSGRSV